MVDVEGRKQARSNTRLLLLILLVLVLSILGSISQAFRLRRNVGGAREGVAPFAETYIAALAAGDSTTLLAMADPNADPAWRAMLEQEPRRLWVPLATWTIERVAEMEGTGIVQVTLNGTLDADGVPVPAYWRLYFVQDGEVWRPTFPNVNATWGPQTTLPFAEGIRMTYRLDEARDVPPALSDLFTFWEDVRQLAEDEQVRQLAITIDPLEPFEAVRISEEEGNPHIAARSPWSSHSFLAPETELRARVAWGILQVVEAPSPRHRAALQALARFWVGQVNDIHPLFDAPLIRDAQTWETEIPSLAQVLAGNAPEPLQTTAWLWLLSEGMTTEQIIQIMETSSSVEIDAFLTAWRGQTSADLNATWQEAVRTRYQR
nr:hypothetical protein [Ardenticatena sp.]